MREFTAEEIEKEMWKEVIGYVDLYEVRVFAKYCQSLSGSLKKMNNHMSKPVVYKGKWYSSQSECARENGLHLSQLNREINH